MTLIEALKDRPDRAPELIRNAFETHTGPNERSTLCDAVHSAIAKLDGAARLPEGGDFIPTTQVVALHHVRSELLAAITEPRSSPPADAEPQPDAAELNHFWKVAAEAIAASLDASLLWRRE